MCVKSCEAGTSSPDVSLSQSGDVNARSFRPLTETHETVIRLDEDQYLALEKSLVGPTVTSGTTDLFAGYQLGVQEVLRKLRAGYVVGR